MPPVIYARNLSVIFYAKLYTSSKFNLLAAILSTVGIGKNMKLELGKRMWNNPLIKNNRLIEILNKRLIDISCKRLIDKSLNN